jgi:ADP-ribose pyrophosphatase YjhB (NUDIX family)
MTAVGKVTALITRLGANGPELCVFDHPKAGVQVPAGTLLPDEDVYAGALRVAFEETGLDDLQLRSELAVVPGSPSGGGVRHVVHFVAEGAAPDEWYVTTPDGGGLCWRCHWLDIADAATLNADQQPWLEAARYELLQAKHPPARRRLLVDPDAQTDLTIEMFWAPPWSGTRALASWLDPAHGPPDDLIQRAEAVAFTEGGELVAVADGDTRLAWWSLPGGRREPWERVEETLRRELLEEACVHMQTSELLGFVCLRHLNGERAGRVTTDALFWARVEMLPFEPTFEPHARRELSLAAARDLPLWANPITQRVLTLAAEAELRHTS